MSDKFYCQMCGRSVTGTEYHPYWYCVLEKASQLDIALSDIQSRDKQIENAARLDELSHIEPIPEAEPYLRFWWGEKNGERDIAMTLSERIKELKDNSNTENK